MDIDLHHMNRNEAIRFFVSKYNEIFKDGYRGSINVIHGYGSSGKGGVIKKTFKEFLNTHKKYLSYTVDVNPGVTIVTPIKSIPLLIDEISIEILNYCSSAPRSMDKIKGSFFKKYSNQEITSSVKRLVKQDKLEVILKKKGDTYKTKEA